MITLKNDITSFYVENANDYVLQGDDTTCHLHALDVAKAFASFPSASPQSIADVYRSVYTLLKTGLTPAEQISLTKKEK